MPRHRTERAGARQAVPRRLPTALWCVMAALAALLACSPPASATPRRALMVVVSSALPVSDIGLDSLRHLFRGNTVTLGGRRLIPFNHTPGAPQRRAFDALVLGLSADDVGRYWIDRRIRGKGQAPRSVPSRKLALALVTKLPGAIVYLWDGPVPSSLRVLRVDGKAPSHRDYPLR